jgi:hypothetical protein
MCLLTTHQGSSAAGQLHSICEIAGQCDAPSRRSRNTQPTVVGPSSIGTDATSFMRSRSSMSGRFRDFRGQCGPPRRLLPCLMLSRSVLQQQCNPSPMQVIGLRRPQSAISGNRRRPQHRSKRPRGPALPPRLPVERVSTENQPNVAKAQRKGFQML